VTKQWWLAIGAATAELECSGEQHVLEWRDGALHLHGHPDVDAERALGALGGEAPACVALRDRWERYAGDVALVTLGRRAGEETLGVRDPVAIAVGGGRAPTRRGELLSLLSLPAQIIDRLVLESVASAAGRWADEQFRTAHGLRFATALRVRATPALTRASASIDGIGSGTASTGSIDMDVVPARPGASTSGVAQRSRSGGLIVRAALPLGWIASVWGAGLSEVEGRMVIDLRGEVDGGYAADVVDWVEVRPGQWRLVPAPAVVVRDGGGAWALASERARPAD